MEMFKIYCLIILNSKKFFMPAFELKSKYIELVIV